MSTVNLVLDIILVGASVWMVATVSGLGGIVGRTLNLITIGAVVLGLAHLLATLMHRFTPMESSTESFIHRLIVLSGFVLLVVGFRRIRELKA
ncbi:MAG: hypothetical protein A2Z37_05130 [Chloroflexi bacterium RBG_19FT_COMBO_62_14]|nr:MAG: hypothetical protein A2Z37_05130 [Chloroflexi bacterium RBG_19FT_COMBO_62_14]